MHTCCYSNSNRSPYRIQYNSSSNRSTYRIQCNSNSNRSPYRIQRNSNSNRSPYRIQCNSNSNRSPYRIQRNSNSNRSPYRIQCNSNSNRSPYRIQCNRMIPTLLDHFRQWNVTNSSIEAISVIQYIGSVDHKGYSISLLATTHYAQGSTATAVMLLVRW